MDHLGSIAIVLCRLAKGSSSFVDSPQPFKAIRNIRIVLTELAPNGFCFV
jgi:hypothetical protein